MLLKIFLLSCLLVVFTANSIPKESRSGPAKGNSFSSRKDLNKKFLSEEEEIQECLSTREFVTTLEFLRKNKKKFGLNEKLAYEVADKVSIGCTGASSRFLKTMHLLIESSIDSTAATNIGVRFALSSNEKTNAFITIFKYAYLKKFLDLDLLTSVDLALSLSIDFNGHSELAEKDFSSIISFCLGEAGPSLGQGKCLELSKTLVKLGEKFEKSISASFIKIYEYLTSKSGVYLIAGDALNVSLQVVKYGPLATENFIQAYKYAISDSGLDLSRNKAIKFAKQMSSRSFKLKTPR